MIIGIENINRKRENPKTRDGQDDAKLARLGD